MFDCSFYFRKVGFFLLSGVLLQILFLDKYTMKANLIFKYYLALKQFFQSALKGYAKKILILKTYGILEHACKIKNTKKKKKREKEFSMTFFFQPHLLKLLTLLPLCLQHLWLNCCSNKYKCDIRQNGAGKGVRSQYSRIVLNRMNFHILSVSICVISNV